MPLPLLLWCHICLSTILTYLFTYLISYNAFSGARANPLGPEAVPVLALRKAVHALGLVQQSRDVSHLPSPPQTAGGRQSDRLAADDCRGRRTGRRCGRDGRHELRRPRGVHHHTSGRRNPRPVADPHQHFRFVVVCCCLMLYSARFLIVAIVRVQFRVHVFVSFPDCPVKAGRRSDPESRQDNKSFEC